MFELERNTIITSAKLSVAYRFSMILSVLTGPMFLVINLIMWRAIFSASGKETIGGFTLEQMITYLAVTLVIQFLVWDDGEQHIANKVKDGTFITYLLRPASYLWYAFLWKIGHRSVAFVIEFLPVLLVVTLLVGPQRLLAGHVGYLAGTLVMAFIIVYLIKAILGMLAFWLTRINGILMLYRVINPFLYGAFIPLSILPQAVQKVVIFLPFQFVSYVPARAFLGEYTLAGITLTPLQVFAFGTIQIFILLSIVIIMWHAAVKRFQGVGV